MRHQVCSRTLIGLAALLLTASCARAQEPKPAGRPGVTRPADDAKPVPVSPAGPKSAAPS